LPGPTNVCRSVEILADATLPRVLNGVSFVRSRRRVLRSVPRRVVSLQVVVNDSIAATTMPFTGAHPMAVLPLLRWRRTLGLDATCLVIGSMAPDVEYFVRGGSLGVISHTARGLVAWNLPVTLILGALLHAIVKWPLLLVAPAAISSRAVALVGGPWRERWGLAAVASCAISAVLGAASHIAWDSFTHADKWGTEHVRALTARVTVPLYGTTAVHRVLQYVSTVVGLIVLTVVVVRALRRAPARAIPALPRIRARIGFALGIAAGSALAFARIAAVDHLDINTLVINAIDGVLGGVLVASALLYRAGRRAARCLPPVPSGATSG
jgi:hypothetical protein